MDIESNCNSKTKVGMENLCNLLGEGLVLHSKRFVVVVYQATFTLSSNTLISFYGKVELDNCFRGIFALSSGLEGYIYT